MIAHWPFDDGTGNRADDAIKNNNYNTALLNGVAGWDSVNKAIGGSALSLDGNNDSADIRDAQDFNFDSGDDWSFALWVRPDNISSKDAVFTKTFGNASARYGLLRDGGDWRFVMNGDNMSGSVGSKVGGIWPWSHIVISKKGSTVKMFVNAVQKDAMSAQNTKDSNDQFLIGDASGSTSINNFDGLIDDMRIYERSLTDEEITIICRQGASASTCS